MQLAENESVGLGVCVACETGGAGVLDGTFRLVVGPEPFKSPSARVFVEAEILDHHVDAAAVAFEDDPVLLLSLAQFVHDDGAIGKIARRVSINRFRIREDVVHSLFALGEGAAGQDDSGADMNPATEVVGILHGFGAVQEAE